MSSLCSAVRNNLTRSINGLLLTRSVLSGRAGSALPAKSLSYSGDGEDRKSFPETFDQQKCGERRTVIEKQTGADLHFLGTGMDPYAFDKNISVNNTDLVVGTAKIPVAVIGPLKINGVHARGEFWVPMATTEGALTASTNRGAAVLAMCGGVKTSTGEQRCSRAPCFIFENSQQALTFGEWVRTKLSALQTELATHNMTDGILREIVPVYDNEAVHIIFRYETGDSAGQRIATQLTTHSVEWLMERLPEEIPPDKVKLRKKFLEMGMSGDGRINIMANALGKGLQASAETTIPAEVIEKVFHTSTKNFIDCAYYTERIALKSGGIGGANINSVNALTALFLACGQDIGAIAEGCTSNFDVRKNVGPEGGVHFAVMLPNLVISTVDSGTLLPTQSSCLDMIGCRGPGKVRKFGEIVAATCLALDLSLCAAMAADEFAAAHEQHGRNKEAKAVKPKQQGEGQ